MFEKIKMIIAARRFVFLKTNPDAFAAKNIQVQKIDAAPRTQKARASAQSKSHDARRAQRNNTKQNSSQSHTNWAAIINMVLLLVIIVLFGTLTINLLRNRAHRQAAAPVVEHVAAAPVKRTVQPRPAPKPKTVTPVKSDDVIVRPVPSVQTTEPAKPASVQRNKLYGDIIIDSRAQRHALRAGDMVRGNVFIQNMHKYVLPCDVYINGNLFLRNMGMVQFCGDFTITGNIYVSPNSSFGPVSPTSRLGGYVVL